MLAEAEAIDQLENSPMAFVASENWHPGVIGIVASRLKDRFHHPALVVSLEGDIGKGSGRSVNSVDLGAAIIAARQAGLLINGGGHKMAAGFTVARDKMRCAADGLYADFLALPYWYVCTGAKVKPNHCGQRLRSMGWLAVWATVATRLCEATGNAL